MPIRELPQPLAYSMKDAAEAVGISLSLMERVIKRGDITVRWIDGKRVILTSEMLAWLESLPYDKPD